jgi:hypothetical protein
VLALFTEEHESGSIIHKLNPLNALIKDCSELLFRIQQLEFDLGLVAYQRGTPKEAIVAAARKEQMIQERVVEACAEANEIFHKRGIRSEMPLDMHEGFHGGRKNNA